jgi:hypothetical protein
MFAYSGKRGGRKKIKRSRRKLLEDRGQRGADL